MGDHLHIKGSAFECSVIKVLVGLTVMRPHTYVHIVYSYTLYEQKHWDACPLLFIMAVVTTLHL